MRTLFLAVLFAFTASPVAAQTAYRNYGAPQPPPSDYYQVGAKDILQIQVYDEENLTGEFEVATGGHLDFPLVGRIDVVGLTPSQIDDVLTSRLASGFLVNPQVSVQVITYGSQEVRILGAVDKPGAYALQGHTNLLDVLSLAGGVTDDAMTEVRIQRKDDSQPNLVIKLDALLAPGEGNVPIRPDDVVIVPQGVVVYVSGEVESPGSLVYRDGLTVTQALTDAGGPSPTAKLRDAYVLRNGEKIPLNIKRIFDGQDKDMALQPYDQLFIRESFF